MNSGYFAVKFCLHINEFYGDLRVACSHDFFSNQRIQSFFAVEWNVSDFGFFLVCFLVEENDHLKAENRSLKKDLLAAIENSASGEKKVQLKGEYWALWLLIVFYILITCLLDDEMAL